MTENVQKLNEIYDDHKDDCMGMFHNDLWQIMMNKSCTGAFIRLYDLPSEDGQARIGIAQRGGGYIPTNFTVDDGFANGIIEDLNERVFGLTPISAEEIVAASFRNNA